MGAITEAVSTEVWSGEAAVHVSIVNWVKGKAPGPKMLHTQLGDSSESSWKIEALEVISSTLSTATDVTGAVALRTNQEPKRSFQGQNPVNDGFFLTPDEAAVMIREDARNRDVIFPYMIGRDLVEDHAPSRWIIDFAQRDQFAARAYRLPWVRIQDVVMPAVVARAEREKQETGKEGTRWSRMAERWWQFRDDMPGTMSAIAPLSRYVLCPRVTERPIFEFISADIHPDGATMVFPFADDYSFGLLQSDLHFAWFRAKGSTLKGDFRYTSDTVFDTFPWPQAPTREQIKAVADTAVALRALRRETMRKLNYSLRDLYRTLEQPGDNPLREAHARLTPPCAPLTACPPMSIHSPFFSS